MGKAGAAYQEQVAEFFRSRGLSVEIEYKVEGARAKHQIDVWATGHLYGLPIRWAVECKDWATNIPKERVVALYSIVQDVGADHGFLLSEKGFQSGAIQFACRTNITLSSIANLAEITSAFVREDALSKILVRLERLKSALGDVLFEIKGRARDDTSLCAKMSETPASPFITVEGEEEKRHG
jgi:Restriction endonuclease